MKLINKLVFPIFAFTVLFLGALAHYFSLNRYNNFVYGKFDLGNMNQMLYNSSRGKFMILTDYFGENVSRFSMSHVDPSLLIFIPINWFYSDANFLLFAQTTAFVISSFLLYLISRNDGLSKVTSASLGLLVMLMPISGYILVWTTFHSLILGMPFLLGGYYIFQLLVKNKKRYLAKSYFKGRLSSYNLMLSLAYVCFALVVLSKEELGFVLALFGFFMYFNFKELKKHILIISVTAFIWSIICFLVIIPAFADQRVTTVDKFVENLGGVDDDSFKQLRGENYFLYRYSQFGNSYSEIAKNLIFKPGNTINFIFSQDNLTTFNRLLLPLGYLPLFSPLIIIAVSPELAIQVLASEEGVFSITNHRLLILIPLFLLALIYLFKFIKIRFSKLPLVISLFLLLLNLFLGYKYQNPLIYPLADKVFKKVVASSQEKIEFENDINPKCAQFLVNQVNNEQFVSVPQPLGAKTSNKTFNALFPAGLENANSIITDIYARKLVDFLDISTDYNKDAVANLLDKNNVELKYSCNRFFLLKKSESNVNLGTIEIVQNNNLGPNNIDNKDTILKESYLIDFAYNQLSDNSLELKYTYKIGDESDRKSLFAYTVLVPAKGGDNFSFLHFPSTYVKPLNSFPTQSIVTETIILNLPTYYSFTNKEFNVYFGIGNREKNENNTLAGKIVVK